MFKGIDAEDINTMFLQCSNVLDKPRLAQSQAKINGSLPSRGLSWTFEQGNMLFISILP